MLRRVAAGAGRRSQINGRKHATTQVAPNLAYSDPVMAEIALRNIGRRAKQGKGAYSNQLKRSKTAKFRQKTLVTSDVTASSPLRFWRKKR